jgi:hypothetical protein
MKVSTWSAYKQSPTKSEVVTNLNKQINTLDLEIISKTDDLKEKERLYKEAQKSLDDSKNERANYLKEKAKIVE